MRDPKINVRVPSDIIAMLAIAARAPKTTKAEIVEAALREHLSPDRQDERFGVVHRQLDDHKRQLERMQRDHRASAEMIALFVLYFLTTTPPLPEDDKQAARQLGNQRFESFQRRVGENLAGTDAGTVARILRDFVPDADDYATVQPTGTEGASR